MVSVPPALARFDVSGRSVRCGHCDGGFCQNSDADRAEILLTPAFAPYTAATSSTSDLHRSMKMRR
jgi:hypothetical protein